ncbi:hypothetical protein LEP1GSC188_3103 [Leptospira weilii serovar Topaz str. LT2116]|uniref:Uncharacterized protein n=1 Tax=Leptospira weilii serovar Topaz str. LT2116 TaxID=1088540 RepID=M3FKD6_9LEPT|nr:hypothetical protein LEP1GSC188_3103 [Leptospira weilii serovar Topaz str. LT2116]
MFYLLYVKENDFLISGPFAFFLEYGGRFLPCRFSKERKQLSGHGR